MQKLNGYNIADNLYEPTLALIKAAWADKINLTVGSGTRTYEEQLALRKKHVIDKSKVNDLVYLKTEDNGLFYPRTARPGTSNHEPDDKGIARAIDFSVTGKPDVYAWLVKNAFKHGWIRTVPSERWHWEKQPECKNMFQYVKKSDPTWDGLLA